MGKRKINIGLVGLGRIGKMHAKNICQSLPSFNLKSIVDPDPDIEFAPNLEGAIISDNIENILIDKTIGAVIVCSPTPTHYEIIKRCVMQKKHVFCEKPISFSEHEIKELITIKDRENIFIQVGLNRRFDQDFLMAKKKMDSGALGDIHAIHITNHDASIPPFKFLKSSGGMLFDLCIHDFDMLSFLTGQKVKEIYVNGGVFIDKRLRDIGDVDNAIITLELENGVLCSIDSSSPPSSDGSASDEAVMPCGAASDLSGAPRSPHSVASTMAMAPRRWQLWRADFGGGGNTTG